MGWILTVDEPPCRPSRGARCPGAVPVHAHSTISLRCSDVVATSCSPPEIDDWHDPGHALRAQRQPRVRDFMNEMVIESADGNITSSSTTSRPTDRSGYCRWTSAETSTSASRDHASWLNQSISTSIPRHSTPMAPTSAWCRSCAKRWSLTSSATTSYARCGDKTENRKCGRLTSRREHHRRARPRRRHHSGERRLHRRRRRRRAHAGVEGWPPGAHELLVESGGSSRTRRSSRSTISNRRRPAAQNYMSRARYFGGSCNLWAGRCMRLQALDLAGRDWVPDSAWPIAADELAVHYPQAARSWARRLPSSSSSTGPDTAERGERRCTLARARADRLALGARPKRFGAPSAGV